MAQCVLRGLITLVVGIGLASAASAAQGGLQFSAAVDLVGDYSLSQDSDKAADKFEPRTVDFMVYSAIDPYFDGTMSMAAHSENGESLFELHEAFVSSDRLIPMSEFRLGQFFLDIGRLGALHQHEWPMIATPLVYERFFDQEGLLDSGAEYSLLLPLDFYLDITVGVTNGFVFGHSHDEGERPRQPVHYLHALGFFSLGSFNVQPGLSLVRRQAADGLMQTFYGLELTGKLRQGKVIKWLVQAEVWQRMVKPEGGDEEITLGGYSLVQYGFDNGITVGVQVDHLEVTTLEDATGAKVDNAHLILTPSIGIKPSEFSQFRLAYERETIESPIGDDLENDSVLFQATFSLGAHPAHAF